MRIDLPADAEALVVTKAAQAGFQDVGEYVLDLIVRDEPGSATAIPRPNDPGIIRAAEEGYASGPGGKADEQFWKERRDELEACIASQAKDS